MSARIRIGAVDWRHAAWTGAFYPDDMPEEWRLSYYSGQYNCVFLAARDWRSVGPAGLRQWCDEVHARFVFLLEEDAGTLSDGGLDGKTRLLARGDARLVWFDAHSDLKQLAEAIRARAEHGELYLLSRDADLAQMDRVNTLLELMGY